MATQQSKAFRWNRLWLLVPLTVAGIGCGDKPSPTNAPPQQTTGRADPQPGVQPQPTGGSVDQDLRTAKPDVVMTAADLNAEFAKEPAAAMKKYAGKVLELTGVMGDYNYDADGPVIVFGNRFGPRFKLAGESAVAQALPGQSVTLRAKCVEGRGVVGGVVMKAEGEPPATMTAEAWSKEVAADEKAADKKYKDKHLVLTGTVSAIDDSDGFRITLTPKGTEPPVVCSFATAGDVEKKRNQSLKVGHAVKVIGRLVILTPNKLQTCDVIPAVK